MMVCFLLFNHTMCSAMLNQHKVTLSRKVERKHNFLSFYFSVDTKVSSAHLVVYCTLQQSQT